MATTDRVAFINTNVTWTPVGGSPSTLKVASFGLTRTGSEADATTTEDDGEAFSVITLSKSTGTMRVYQREGEALPLKTRDRGNLTWNINTTNAALGNYNVPVQVKDVNIGEADVNGVIPCVINVVGRGKWANGPFGV